MSAWSKANIRLSPRPPGLSSCVRPRLSGALGRSGPPFFGDRDLRFLPVSDNVCSASPVGPRASVFQEASMSLIATDIILRAFAALAPGKQHRCALIGRPVRGTVSGLTASPTDLLAVDEGAIFCRRRWRVRWGWRGCRRAVNVGHDRRTRGGRHCGRGNMRWRCRRGNMNFRRRRGMMLSTAMGRGAHHL
jgi:hypothetical protein